MNRSFLTILLGAAAVLSLIYGYLQSSNLSDQVAIVAAFKKSLAKVETDLKSARDEATKLGTAQKAAEAAAKKATDELAKVEAARKAAEDNAKSASAAIQAAKDEATKAAGALKAMEADLKAARDQVGQLTAAKAAAEAAVASANAKLAEEQKLRDAVEQALAAAKKATQ